MTTLNYSALRKKAAEAGGGDGELLPVGEYDGEIVGAGAKAKSAGYGLWWKFKVLTGPEAGKTAFLNQQLNPENGAQLDIFFRVVKDLGIDFDAVPDGTPIESVAKLAVGRKFSFEIVHNTAKDGSGKVFANFKNVKRLDAETPAPTVAAPAAPAAEPTPAGDAPKSALPF